MWARRPIPPPIAATCMATTTTPTTCCPTTSTRCGSRRTKAMATANYDLVVRNARLHRRPQPVDVAIAEGRFVRVAADLGSVTAAREIDAAGRLLSPPFID